jgi:DNA-binding MarR family transcriptional regulator
LTEDVLVAAEKAGVVTLTTEGKILNYLNDNGTACVKEVMYDLDASYRGFYIALERLKLANVVRSEISPQDKRVRLLFLNLGAQPE